MYVTAPTIKTMSLGDKLLDVESGSKTALYKLPLWVLISTTGK